MCAVQVSVVTGSAQASLEAVVRDWAGAGDWCQVSSVQLSTRLREISQCPTQCPEILFGGSKDLF